MRIQYKRLEKLAQFLDNLSNAKFDFGSVVKESEIEPKICGTVCCAIGWTPKVFPRLVGWYSSSMGRIGICCKKTNKQEYHEIAHNIFGISYDEAVALFTPGVRRPWMKNTFLTKTTRPETLAKSIRVFVKWKKAGYGIKEDLLYQLM